MTPLGEGLFHSDFCLLPSLFRTSVFCLLFSQATLAQELTSKPREELIH